MSQEAEKTALVLLVSDGTKIPPIWQYTQSYNPQSYIHLAVSNKAQPRFFSFAKENDIPAVTVQWNKRAGESREDYSYNLGRFVADSLAERLTRPESYLVISAGQPYILTNEFTARFDPKRVINIHPGLLPDNPKDNEVVVFNGDWVPALKGVYDHNLMREVLKRKIKWTGITYHYLTGQVDSGLVIMRAEVLVLENDTIESLAQRVHTKEDEMMPEVLDRVIKR